MSRISVRRLLTAAVIASDGKFSSNLTGKVNKLRARNSKAWNDGVFDFVAASGGLYKEARALLEEMDETEIQIDVCDLSQ